MDFFPQLNLHLGITNCKGSVFYAGDGVLTSKSDSALHKHTIAIFITEEETGSVKIANPHADGKTPATLELPTYKMLVIDSLTAEKHTYDVTRDFVMPAPGKGKKRSLWSLLTFNLIRPSTYAYNVLTYEPLVQEMEAYRLLKHRTLNHSMLHYTFQGNKKIVSLFAGDFDAWKKPADTDSLFVVMDGNKGQRFIGDILYREKFLKLTPRVQLNIIRRKKVPKSIQFDKKGNINKIIYL